MSIFSKNSLPQKIDDRPIWDLLSGIVGYPAILIAHELKIFSLLGEKKLSLQEISEKTSVALRPLEALLRVCLLLGFINFSEGFYSLSKVSEEYFLESSPNYCGAFLDFIILNYSNWTFDSFKKVILSNKPLFSEDLFQSELKEENKSISFIEAMHSISQSPALFWPQLLDLNSYKTFLDIGGGSGAHSIGLIRKWPNLQAIVLDLENICKITEKFITKANLQNQISTYSGDMWKDPFPEADIHFYSMIFHDWPMEKCYFLAKKSFETLKPGGCIIIHEMLYEEKKTAPLAVACIEFEMLLWVKGQEFSGKELALILENTGFIDIKIKPSFGYWGIVTGYKPT